VLALAAALAAAAPAAIANDKLPGLVETITAKLAARTGFAAQMVGGDTIVALNGDEAFPMASAYKIAIAGKVLAMVDKGEVRLEQMVDIPLESYVPSPVIADNLIHPGVALSVANLLEIMIVHSDNTATDSLMALAGGPAAVTAWLREIGIEGMSVDRSTAQLSEQIQAIMEAAGSHGDSSNPAVPEFDADPRDQTTPNDMLRLLILLDLGNVLKPQSRDFLLGVMGRTVTGPGRIKGLLPVGTPVAHKTGTVGGIANDVGYVTLPDGRRFAVAIFTKGSTTPPVDRDRAVAETARVLYDFFALQ
jgi:beta-lactamase class A